MARILQDPELLRLNCRPVRPEYFNRPENREIWGHILYVQSDGFDESAIEWLRQTVEGEVASHLDYLFNKSLPPVEPRQGTLAVAQTARRLEERYLRSLKAEESIRFADAEDDNPPDGTGILGHPGG